MKYNPPIAKAGYNANMKHCPRCGCTMYKAMRQCGSQLWVCSDPNCGTIVEEKESKVNGITRDRIRRGGAKGN